MNDPHTHIPVFDPLIDIGAIESVLVRASCDQQAHFGRGALRRHAVADYRVQQQLAAERRARAAIEP